MHEMNEKYVPYRGYDAPYIFVSYAHKDGNKESEVIGKLQMEQYRVWYDEGIDPGTEWDENIAEHIENCEYFIALLSREYLVSSNCKDELNFARELEKPRLLIYLEDIQLPGGMRMRLSRLQAIHKYKYQSMELFFEKLAETQGLEKCHEKQKQEKTIIIESTEVVQETPRITIPRQAMNMSTDQIDYLSSLPRGYAAVYAEGDNRPKCVKFPLVVDRYSLTREQVIQPIKARVDQKLIDDFKSVHCGCSYCEEKCKYLGNVKSRVDHIKNLQVYIEKMKETQYSVKVIEKILDAVSVNETLLSTVPSRICLLGYLLEKGGLTKGKKKKVISRYIYDMLGDE